MYFYLVWVRSNRYHGHEPLTYKHNELLPTGSLVRVELQNQVVLGVISGPTAQPRFQTKSINEVLPLPPLPGYLLRLAVWLQSYYPAPIGLLSQQLMPASLSAKQLALKVDQKLPPPDTSQLPALTKEQIAALAGMQKKDNYILHGATGSGKTRLYVELAVKAVSGGRSAIILTPEISLTSQLAESFKAVFGPRVIIVHSNQAPSERQQAWLRALCSDQPLVVVGPRSALFSPLQKIGLIVMDEAHESAYKQEQAPQYQTARVAAALTQLTPASLILGSASPSVSDYFLAEQKQKPIIEMSQPALPAEPVLVTMVDRKDHAIFDRSAYISRPLITATEASLKRGEQTLLYLNRRGTARLVLCENCGWQATCPHCDLPLTYHGDRHQLRCHSCNYKTGAPTNCPECRHPGVVFKAAGTKAIADEVKRLFPGAKVARFDTDNAKPERFEQQYTAIKEGSADILVGTQLLAKGLDLPRLSTLGILLADTSLYLPDFSAQERTYQLISQVLGRVGRGHLPGAAVIQTYHPDHPVLVAAVNNDYQGFYKTELASRQQFLFPPFCYLLKLTVRRASSQSAETAAVKLKTDIEASGLRVRVEGPAPAFYERLQGKHQWQLVVKAKDRAELLKIITDLPANWSYDIDPSDLL